MNRLETWLQSDPDRDDQPPADRAEESFVRESPARVFTESPGAIKERVSRRPPILLCRHASDHAMDRLGTKVRGCRHGVHQSLVRITDLRPWLQPAFGQLFRTAAKSLCAPKSRLKGGCSQDWLPHNKSRTAPAARCGFGKRGKEDYSGWFVCTFQPAWIAPPAADGYRVRGGQAEIKDFHCAAEPEGGRPRLGAVRTYFAPHCRVRHRRPPR